MRIDRLAISGNVGDAKPVGEGTSEMKIDYGPGYRLYFAQCELGQKNISKLASRSFSSPFFLINSELSSMLGKEFRVDIGSMSELIFFWLIFD